jgi:hypothetical protein
MVSWRVVQDGITFGSNMATVAEMAADIAFPFIGRCAMLTSLANLRKLNYDGEGK